MAWRQVSCLSSLLFFVTLLAVFLNVVEFCNAGKTSNFIRKYPSTDLPFDADVFAEPPGHNAPQQVHITQGNHDGRAMIVSWVYPFKGLYITIGDGGNIEGLAFSMTNPQPEYSVYREASFGHGIFDIKNRTHAYFSWNRNEDQYSTEADFHNRFWYDHVQESD
ncbi:hypothetical protein MLD38_023394 [Melastoma candidum]|uniref:Uncharacterized protein n=1 Tax=Melastoma candidum TaxID=119954 RepID=A0ACB9QMY1_9MYRT|nr:hypothetical protein MLD38_023394 [Melastoma candidum]